MFLTGFAQPLHRDFIFNAGAHNIETQYLDGEITEYDLDAWRELHLTRAEAPEDWRAGYELNDDDALDPDLPFHPENWDTTSDSLAAKLAVQTGADELVLLKSRGLPTPAPALEYWGASDLVDPRFPSIASRIPNVRWVNLRA